MFRFGVGARVPGRSQRLRSRVAVIGAGLNDSAGDTNRLCGKNGFVGPHDWCFPQICDE